MAARDNGPLTPADQTVMDRLKQVVRTMPHAKTVRDLSTSPDGAARQTVIHLGTPWQKRTFCVSWRHISEKTRHRHN